MEEVILDLIHSVGLGRLSGPLRELAHPAIRLCTTAVPEDGLEIGASKLGGLPDLPPELRWPEYDDIALHFLAQIRLEEVAPYDKEKHLPPTGLLYFFYDATDQPHGEREDRGRWKVLHYDGPKNPLRRAKAPDTLPEEEWVNGQEAGLFNSCGIEFAQQWTLPCRDSPYIDALRLNVAERDRYRDLLTRWQEQCGKTGHCMLGHPTPMHSDVLTDCQLYSHGVDYYSQAADKLIKKATDWRLLLQLDTDDEAGWMWGDAGMVYFLIRQKSLQERKFKDAWLIRQE